MSDNTTAEGMTGAEALALVKTSALRRLAAGMLVHGNARILPAHYLRPDGICPACAVGTYLNATADALDALRESVKGCEEMVYQDWSTGPLCGDRDVDGLNLCESCKARRDAAIDRLISETGEGNG